MKVRINNPNSRYYGQLFECIDFLPSDKVAFVKVFERGQDITNLVPVATTDLLIEDEWISQNESLKK